MAELNRSLDTVKKRQSLGPDGRLPDFLLYKVGKAKELPPSQICPLDIPRLLKNANIGLIKKI